MHAADIPATQTLSVLPRRLLIVEGLQALLVPLLIGGGLALIVHFSRRVDEAVKNPTEAKEAADHRLAARATAQAKLAPKLDFVAGLKEITVHSEPIRAVRRLNERYSPRALVGMAALTALVLLLLTLAIVQIDWRWIVGAGVLGATLAAGVAVALSLEVRVPTALTTAAVLFALVAPLIGAMVALGFIVEWGYLLVIGLVTVAFAWLTVGALARHGASGAGAAWTLLAALALWSGVVGFLRLAGARHPELEKATVQLKKGEPVRGFYLGGSGGDVYIASGDPRVVRLIREEDVADLSVGEAEPVPPSHGVESRNVGGESTGGQDAEVPGLHVFGIPVETMLDGIPLQLEVVGFHRGGTLLTLDLRLKNLSDPSKGARPFTVGDAFDDGVADGQGNVLDSLDALRLTDQNGSLTYPVARDEDGRCVCTDDLRRVTINSGEFTLVTATFGRPGDGAMLLLHARGFPTLNLQDDG
jgi:hypothetical protein